MIEANNSILKNDLLGVHFFQLQNRLFSPNPSLFHFFPAFGAQKSNFKHSTYKT